MNSSNYTSLSLYCFSPILDGCPQEILSRYVVYMPELAKKDESSSVAISAGSPLVSSIPPTVVYYGKNKATNTAVAIKLYDPAWLEYHKDQVTRKIDAAKALAACGVGPEVLDTIHCRNGALALVTEFCNAGSLGRARGKMTEPVIREVALFLVQALMAMEECGVSCRYMAPPHVLVKLDPRVGAVYKLIGCTALDWDETSSDPATTPFAAPETLATGKHTAMADIWSAGMLLYFLATGEVLGGFDPRLTSMARSSVTYPPGVKMSGEFKDWMGKCLVADPVRRCSAAELLRHPFVFQGMGGSIQEASSKAPEFDFPVERTKLCSTVIRTQLQQQQKHQDAPVQKPHPAKEGEEEKKELFRRDFKAFAVKCTNIPGLRIEHRMDLGAISIAGTLGRDESLCKGTLETAEHTAVPKIIRVVDLSVADIRLATAAVNEINTLGWLSNSPYFVSLENSIIVGDKLHLVMKWCSRGTLESFVTAYFAKQSQAYKQLLMPPQDLSTITWGVACALKKLMRIPMFSVSLHPCNILLVAEGESQKLSGAKLASVFSLSPSLAADEANLREDTTNEAGQVRAFGRFMYYCLFGEYPKASDDVLSRIPCKKAMALAKENSDYKEYIALMEKCLQMKAAKRPKIADIVKDPFFCIVFMPNEGQMKMKQYEITEENAKVPAAAACELYANLVTYHKCVRVGGKEALLMKTINLNKLAREKKVKVRNELATMTLLSTCENVVKLHEYFMADASNLCIVTEYFDTNLETYILKRAEGTPLSVGEKAGMALDVIRAIADMHANNVVHRGIRPSAVMIKAGSFDRFVKAKVGGFVVARKLMEDEAAKSFYLPKDELDYTPPEMKGILRHKALDHRADIWSYGMLLYFILYGMHIQKLNKYENMLKGALTYPKRELPAEEEELRKAMLSCLKRQPQDRPTSDALLEEIEMISKKFPQSQYYC